MKILVISFLLTVILLNTSLAQPARAVGGDTLYQADCGIVWEEPILLSDTAFDAHSPKIALSGDDNVHIVWQGGGMKLPYIQSDNSGISFLPVRDLLIDSLYRPGIGHTPFIVTSGMRVYVFFIHAWGIGDSPVTMMVSKNSGVNWEFIQYISSDTTGLVSSVAIYRDTISIIYPTYPGWRHILRSTDAGETWTKTSEDLSVYSQIALTSSALHLVYYRGINSSAEVEYRISHDLGDTWSQTAILSEIDGYWSDMPIISSDGDSSLLVAWRDTKYGCLGVLGCSIESRTGIVSATQDSTIWGEAELLTEKPRGFRVEASLINGMRAVGWVDEVTANDTFHVVTRVSKRNSTGWCPIIDHTPDIQKALYPVVALSSKGIHIVWVQLIGERIAVFYRRGVFKTTNVKDDKNVLPTEVSLSQNYPNPFNPKTSIRFQIPDFRFVSLKVYDVFGREVAILVNEKIEAGEHEVEWNSSNIASGVCFYRLLATDSHGKTIMQTKKMVIIR
ncbi:MAG: hypothetical protein QME52_00905 [Bacteroidota bacterium]|nr:hypothetical protein [Bacteroidota bacterium]